MLSIAGVMPIRKLMFESSPLTSETLNIVLLVPAHNESQGIGRTVANLFALAKADGSASVVVIADNCSDDTATVAAAFGARVLVRHNEVDRGKGFALDFAFKTLAKEGVDAYIVIDADMQKIYLAIWGENSAAEQELDDFFKDWRKNIGVVFRIV